MNFPYFIVHKWQQLLHFGGVHKNHRICQCTLLRHHTWGDLKILNLSCYYHTAHLTILLSILSDTNFEDWTSIYKHFFSSLNLSDIIWQCSQHRCLEVMHNSFLQVLLHTWDKLSSQLLPISRFLPFIIQDWFLTGTNAVEIGSWKKKKVTRLIELIDKMSSLTKKAMNHKLQKHIPWFVYLELQSFCSKIGVLQILQ